MPTGRRLLVSLSNPPVRVEKQELQMPIRSQRSLNRPSVAPRNASRSRAQLSSEMTRLEFERERLDRDLAMLSSRLETTHRALRRIDSRLAVLQGELAI